MRLYVPLTRSEAERLVERAKEQRRRPCDEAAYIITRELGHAPDVAQFSRETANENK